jgi:ribosomal protein L37AE/L43A
MRSPWSLRLVVAQLLATLIGAPAMAESFQENFDGVTPPFVPVNWTASPSWITSTESPDTMPNCARVTAVCGVAGCSFGDVHLASRLVGIQNSTASLTFRHKFDLGGVVGARLEISFDGGATFTEIVAAGGQITQGGYDAAAGGLINPFGANAWNGFKSDYFTTTVQLPEAAQGKVCQFLWHLKDTQNSPGSMHWQIDSVALCDPGCPGDISVEGEPDGCGKVVDYSPPLSDGCAGTCDPPSGSVFRVGITPVTCTASTGPTCSFNVTVTESTAIGARNCSGCGGGMCGAAAAPSMPLTFLLLRTMRRKRRPTEREQTGGRLRV